MSTKFGPGGYAPAKLPPVCKAPPPPPYGGEPAFTALTISLGFGWDCFCGTPVKEYVGGIRMQLTYNPGADQYVGSGAIPGGGLWNAVFDHAPAGYPCTNCLKLLLPCGDEYVGCQTKVNHGQGEEMITFVVVTKHCNVGGGLSGW